MESKSLNLGTDKCKKLHIASSSDSGQCFNEENLKVHNEKLKNVSKLKYLGDFFNQEGNLNDTISDRVNKAIGLRSQIKSLLSNISLGSFYFEISMILHESMYVNSIAFNIETWNYMSEKQIESLEACNIKYFESCLSSNPKTVREAYYIDLGKLSLKHIIAKRKLMYLHNILRRENHEIIKKVYLSQKLKPVLKDWTKSVTKIRVLYRIQIDDDEIANMSKASFKKYINLKIFQFAFNEIMSSRKSKHQNMLKGFSLTKLGSFRMKEYLKTEKLSTQAKKMLFQLRCRNFPVANNYRSMYDDMRCKVCLDEESVEDENHTFFNCQVLLEDTEVNKTIKFDDIYGTLEQQIRAINYLMPLIRKREAILEIREQLT